MKIGLIDLDRTGFPNLALMKLSADHKAQGDEIVFNMPLVKADMTYAACVFPKNVDRLPALDHAILGGTGFCPSRFVEDNPWQQTVWARLPLEAEDLMPDYSLYNTKISYGFTSRGCIRRCPWCVVPHKEGRIKPWHSIYQFWDREHRDIVLLDNNLLASPNWKGTMIDLEREKLRVDFNQGLDIRLVDEEKAYYLSRLKYRKQLRFALDSIKYEREFRQGMEILQEAGLNLHSVMVYFLIGFNSSLEEDLERLEIIKSYKATPFVMNYQVVNGVKPRIARDSRELREFARWINLPHGFYKHILFKEWLKLRGLNYALEIAK